MLVMLAVRLGPGSVLLICHWRSVVLAFWIDFEREPCFLAWVAGYLCLRSNSECDWLELYRSNQF